MRHANFFATLKVNVLLKYINDNLKEWMRHMLNVLLYIIPVYA